MNKFILITGTLLFIIAFSYCEKEPTDAGKLTLVKTTPGGCNLDKSAYILKSATEQKDTVIFSVHQDTWPNHCHFFNSCRGVHSIQYNKAYGTCPAG